MTVDTALIGCGEASRTFAGAPGWQAISCAYDILTESNTTRDLQNVRHAEGGVGGAATFAEALASATAILSVVTADQAHATARNAAQHILAESFCFDMNSVAPDTKRAAARHIEAAGGRYVDAAVMAPVDSARLAVPLHLSGSYSEGGADVLRRLGFANVRRLPGDVGRAPSVKMVRSVMVKGIGR